MSFVQKQGHTAAGNDLLSGCEIANCSFGCSCTLKLTLCTPRINISKGRNFRSVIFFQPTRKEKNGQTTLLLLKSSSVAIMLFLLCYRALFFFSITGIPFTYFCQSTPGRVAGHSVNLTREYLVYRRDTDQTLTRPGYRGPVRFREAESP